jgi:hypothetical protein
MRQRLNEDRDSIANSSFLGSSTDGSDHGYTLKRYLLETETVLGDSPPFGPATSEPEPPFPDPADDQSLQPLLASSALNNGPKSLQDAGAAKSTAPPQIIEWKRVGHHGHQLRRNRESWSTIPTPKVLPHGVGCPPVGVTFPLANPAFPYPQAGHVPVASNICYACNISCKHATMLAKHQTEFCERKVEWVCPACPQKVFGLQERLNRHHMDAHADSCTSGCDKREKLLSEACKMQLSKCSRQLATKKAWGCPCCVKCFESLEEWSHHVSSHPIQNEKVQDWSYNTMTWSLLKQPYISDHVTWMHWQYCSWAKLSKELRLSLRHALERHEVPAAVSAHVDYCGLDGPAALAKYAFNLGGVFNSRF